MPARSEQVEIWTLCRRCCRRRQLGQCSNFRRVSGVRMPCAISAVQYLARASAVIYLPTKSREAQPAVL